MTAKVEVFSFDGFSTAGDEAVTDLNELVRTGVSLNNIFGRGVVIMGPKEIKEGNPAQRLKVVAPEKISVNEDGHVKFSEYKWGDAGATQRIKGRFRGQLAR